jgi:hypothetical protein
MLFALLALVIVAPFERALFTLPGALTVTSVELVALAVVAVYAAAVVGNPAAALRYVPMPAAVAVAAFLLALVIAAALTPYAQANSLRFVARMAMGAVLGLAACHAIDDSRARARALARVMVAVASFVATIAVLEAFQIEAIMSGLTIFRPGFHVVAGQLRATSTFFYPTIASMYLEIAFVLGLWLLLEPSLRRPRLECTLAFVALVLIGSGIIATFTRAGLLAMATALLLVAVFRLARVPRPRAGLGALTTLALALIVLTFVAHSPELLAARLTTEGSDAWYGARYDTPRTLALQTGRVHRVPVTLSNTGRLTWDSTAEPAFTLSYHWLRDGAVVTFEGQRTTFPTPVRPGQQVSLKADIIAPGEPGTYMLAWDLVHETRAWFSNEGVAVARTEAVVTGAPTAAVAVQMPALPAASLRPPRPELWRAAMQIARAHPWVGVGPDNYRLVYGSYIGTVRADPRVHANNMYLEVLTGSGLAGLTTLLVVMGVTAMTLWRRLREATDDTHVGASIAVVVWVVIAGHGLVDSFLSFTTTYVTFSITGGWALSRGLVQGAADAHRV